MKKIIVIFIAAISTSFFVACDYETDYNPPNYASFQTGPSDVKVELGGSTTYDVTVYTANIVSADRTFDIQVRNSSSLSTGAYTVPATVTVPGGTNEGVFTVDIADVDITPNGETLILGFAPEEGHYVGTDHTINVSWSCATPLTIDFEFDGYASETTWNVKDTEGNTLLQGGGFADGTGSASVERCLPDGDYVFTVLDAYGDGLTYPNVGQVTLNFAGEELAVIPGDFGEEATVPFTLGAGSGNGNTDGGDTDGDETDGDETDGGDTGEGEGDGSEGEGEGEGDGSEGEGEDS